MKWGIALFLLLILNQAFSQDKSVFFMRTSPHYGFIIPHSKELEPLTGDPIWGWSADMGWIKTNEKVWDDCNCFGKLGFSLLYFNYNNPEELGSSYNIALFGEPYLGFTKNLYMTLKGGMGLTYLNKVYDEETNPNNLFFSSQLSGILFINLGLNYRLNDLWVLQLAGNYNHISNGGSKQPNKGMNFPTLSLGIERNLVPLDFPRFPKRSIDRRWSYYTRVFSSVRTVLEDSVFAESSHLMIGFEGGAYYALSSINALSGGVEISYDGSFRERNERVDGDDDPITFSVTLGHALVFGRFSFTQQMGWYAIRNFPANDHDFFQRYAMYYRLGEHLSLGFSLKAHGHVADHMDVRIGWEW